MFLRLQSAVLLAWLAVGSLAFSYDEEMSANYIRINQALDCGWNTSDHTAIKTWTCGVACDNTKSVSNVLILNDKKLSTFGIAALYGEDCLLSFRGTKDFLDKLLDADFVTTSPYKSCPDCKVDDGFYAAWKSLENQTYVNLGQLGCDKKQIQITGHSLGGAMASLAAFDLVEKGYQIRRVYTYGQTRVGTDVWASTFEQRLKKVPYFRVVNYKDAVPHLPPSLIPPPFSIKYRHVGHEVYYNATRRGSYVICSDGEDKRCSGKWTWIDGLKGHTCDHCSYLGMNPCDCKATKPDCIDPPTANGMFV